jgi:hypothetical protein
MKKLNQKGFGIVEGLLIFVAVALIAGTGYYVYKQSQNNDKAQSSVEVAVKEKPDTTMPSSNYQQTPQNFIKELLSAVGAGNESQLEKYLSPQYKTFRDNQLSKNGSTPDCKTYYNKNAGTNTKVLALFCGSLLIDPAHISTLNPTVTDFTFKDGKKGKSVEYKEANKGEAGTNYFSFKLIANKHSWLLHDYNDLFVPANDTTKVSNQGLRELTQ